MQPSSAFGRPSVRRSDRTKGGAIRSRTAGFRRGKAEAARALRVAPGAGVGCYDSDRGGWRRTCSWPRRPERTYPGRQPIPWRASRRRRLPPRLPPRLAGRGGRPTATGRTPMPRRGSRSRCHAASTTGLRTGTRPRAAATTWRRGRAEYVAEPSIGHERRAAEISELFILVKHELHDAGHPRDVVVAGASRLLSDDGAFEPDVCVFVDPRNVRAVRRLEGYLDTRKGQPRTRSGGRD